MKTCPLCHKKHRFFQWLFGRKCDAKKSTRLAVTPEMDASISVDNMRLFGGRLLSNNFRIGPPPVEYVPPTHEGDARYRALYQAASPEYTAAMAASAAAIQSAIEAQMEASNKMFFDSNMRLTDKLSLAVDDPAPAASEPYSAPEPVILESPEPFSAPDPSPSYDSPSCDTGSGSDSSSCFDSPSSDSSGVV